MVFNDGRQWVRALKKRIGRVSLPSAFDSRLALRFVTFVVAPSVVFALIVLLFSAWSLQTTVRQSDQAMRDRQVREVRATIAGVLDELAQTQGGVAIWDPAWEEARKPDPDLDWIEDNVGIWLHHTFGHDSIYILNARNEPLFAMVDGKRSDADSYRKVAADLAPLVDSARGIGPRPPSVHDRLDGHALHPDSTVRTSEYAIHATDLAKIDGRAAAVSVMRMFPSSYWNEADAGTEPLLVSVRFLNSGLRKSLADFGMIEGARVTPRPDLPGSGTLSLRLKSSTGEPIGYFTWRPQMPGRAILKSIRGRVIAALAAMAVLLTLLLAGIGRLMARDAKLIGEISAAHTELQAKEAQANYLALHDSLTGLPNRTAFMDFVDRALSAHHGGEGPAVMLVDLDRFKQVNDTLGHLAGDRLIEQVGERLFAVTPSNGMVARLGGDEFAICLPAGPGGPEAVAIAEAALEQLREPFSIIGSTVHIGGSIGIALAPRQAVARTELLRRADIAMYRAKEQGRDGCRVFSADMDRTMLRRLRIEEDLRKVLTGDEGLYVQFQPQYTAEAGRLAGFEALVRWTHPTLGELAPDAFIPVAEDCGLILPLGMWVLKETCRVARAWPRLGFAVNVSPVQLRAPGFASQVTAAVCEAGVSPAQIELEITETMFLDTDESIRSTLAALRKAGFRLAIDDFGTGFSSLNYLSRFHVDRIKIDRSFVARLGQDVQAGAIIETVISLGQALDVSVIAEGVETSEQRAFLQLAGCNTLQGFLFSAAVDERDLPALLESRRPALSGL
ncbi:bifunctional diguanylate cyclase/phosphodiesterase [Croceicoccus sp. YJ47]|uniref:putative bifunctional diguanylate cyclase/phosphodiesterase n=1 Tax=Croceicoccus sp. YJ47 TaxID=2798724 RepID=UPI001920BBE1|nr:EAL domain-containing protein [Croceicoccus sp. YJ47]QQN75250.1 EAL domain-containing protein [Croceicoccus sp. YJ47]